MIAINRIFSAALALLVGAFILPHAASAAQPDQCEILKGKRYLIELESVAGTAFAIVNFAASLRSDGSAGTFFSLAHTNGGAEIVEDDTFMTLPHTLDSNNNGTFSGMKNGAPYCGLQTVGGHAMLPFFTDPREAAAVQMGKQVPKMYYGNGQFGNFQARVYLLPTPWKPQ